ncbi:MAG: transposase [Methylomonas sp.]|jgi:REP element-mobilizing transposase RayT|uniref:transposase n=1 Tax=Methylomonas sp. TaxID=418 RepID=UPI0025D463CE|nr:transposase [Methylomonas sp.]MCK9605913.1 transposase [Methylomonas sp.]
MARPLRLELAGGLYHVTSRGNAGSAIYLDDDDRLNWLALLNDVCSRFNWICHAYCLMSNHYHVVVETVAGNLSNGMRQLNGVYTQNFNRRHKQVGHVFQGRYKAILVEKDSYLLELSRYVVLNPVRAGMVNDVADWPWSSYRATMNLAKPLKCLEVGWLLRQFDLNDERARVHYQHFVRAGIGLPPVWDDLNNQIFLGNRDFVDRLQSRIKAEPHMLKEIPKAQRRPLGQPLHFYVETFPSPKVGMQKAYATGDYTMQQIADAFGVHYATVSRAVNSHSLKNT